jgi:putative spermidine/putrescine transport system substrate-binding protein
VRRVARAAVLGALGLLLALVVPPARSQATREVVFLGFGGTHEKNMKDRVLPPFERAHNVKVVYVTGTMAANFARAQAQKGRPDADVLWDNDLTHVTGKKMGLFEKLDRARVGNLKDVHDVARDAEDIGVMQGFQAEGLEYNAKVFKDRGWPAPTSWRDLWNPAFKGRVGLYAGTNAYTQYLIPMIARLEGGSERATDGAFAKLRELAPSAPTFAVAPAELDNLLKQGEVWITYNGSSRVYELQLAGFPVDFAYPREGALIFGNWFDVLKGAPHPELAQQLVDYLIGVEAQALFARHVFFGPINRQTRLDGETAKKVPFGAEQIARMIKLDFEAMNENVARWTERWNKEIERR